MQNKNTSRLWDDLWNDPSYRKQDTWGLEKEYRSVRWQRLRDLVVRKHGTFHDLSVIELGAGAGKVAALFARHGANVTLVDYSEGALRRARELFERLGLSARYIQADIFDLPSEMKEFDVSLSFGLTEHFLGTQRLDANFVHLAVLREGGTAIISVPNRYNPPYRLYKFLAEATRTWKYGEEYPYSRQEFEEMMEAFGVTEYGFFGDSFVNSFRFFNPIGDLRKTLKLKPPIERGTPLDAYASYSLVLWATRPAALRLPPALDRAGT